MAAARHAASFKQFNSPLGLRVRHGAYQWREPARGMVLNMAGGLVSRLCLGVGCGAHHVVLQGPVAALLVTAAQHSSAYFATLLLSASSLLLFDITLAHLC